MTARNAENTRLIAKWWRAVDEDEGRRAVDYERCRAVDGRRAVDEGRRADDDKRRRAIDEDAVEDEGRRAGRSIDEGRCAVDEDEGHRAVDYEQCRAVDDRRRRAIDEDAVEDEGRRAGRSI